MHITGSQAPAFWRPVQFGVMCGVHEGETFFLAKPQDFGLHQHHDGTFHPQPQKILLGRTNKANPLKGVLTWKAHQQKGTVEKFAT